MNKKKFTSVTLATVVISAGAASAIGAFAADSSTETQCSTAYNQTYGCADVVDEFDGAQLNTQMWQVFDNDWLSYDQGYISAQNVDVSNGSLNLSIVRDQANVTTSDGKYRTWGSARVEQVRSTAQEYGYWEMRVKVPTSQASSQGVWGGAWMLNTDKKGGEIDLVESYGSDNPQSKEPKFSITGKSSSSVHFVPSTGVSKVSAWNTVGDEWHVYGLEKTPEGIKMYIDGVEYLNVSSSDPGYAESFADGTSMYTIFSAQAGSGYWGQPNEQTGNKETISIDYYRYWDMDSDQTSAPATTDTSTEAGSSVEQPTETESPYVPNESAPAPGTGEEEAGSSVEQQLPEQNISSENTSGDQIESTESSLESTENATTDTGETSDSGQDSASTGETIEAASMTQAEGSTVDSSAKVIDAETIEKQKEAQASRPQQKTLASTGFSPMLLAIAVGLMTMGISMLMWTFGYKPLHSGPRHSSIRYRNKHRMPKL